MKRTGFVMPLLLGTFSLVIFLQRYHTRNEPVECDTANQSVLAHEWRLGRPLYSDLWINKPPGGILTFAAAEKLAGTGSSSILFLAALTSILTLFGIYVGTVWMTHDRASGLWAGVFWTLVNGNPYLEANQPMLEGFANVFWVWGAAFAFRAVQEESPSRDLWISGGFLAMASFYKHHLAPANVLFMIGILAAERYRSPRRTTEIFLDSVRAMLPTLFLWAGITAYFLFTHRFILLWDTLLTRSIQYAQETPFGAGGLASNILNSLKPSILSWGYTRGVFYSAMPLAAVCLPGILMIRRADAGRWSILAGYGAAVWLGIALPGRFYPHYYQMLLPPLAIAAGCSINQLGRYPSIFSRYRAVFIWPCLAASLMAVRELRFFRLQDVEWSRLKYGEVYITVKKMGEEIGRNLLPGETFYEIGYDPGLYYYSRCRPPTGILFADDWESGPSGAPFMQRIEEDLARRQPELFITTKFWVASEKNSRLPLMQWCLEHYRPFPRDARHGPFLLYARRGGTLERRLTAQR